MDLDSPRSVEVILSHSQRLLGILHLDWNPQPGAYLDMSGETYLVLERRHRYQLRSGQYHLHNIALYVQKSQTPTEKSLWEGQWVIGDVTCLYNARSKLLRCAINPEGPCDRCIHYTPSDTA